MVSQLLFQLMPALREASGLGSWQTVSAGYGSAVGVATGIMLKLPSVDVLQGRQFDTPHVIFSDTLSGNEDIPANVSAVLTSSSIDVLAHVAIRARDQGVFLATCNDPPKAGELQKYDDVNGKMVAVSMDAAGEVGRCFTQTRLAVRIPSSILDTLLAPCPLP